MTVKEFATCLAGTLIDRGISRDDAVSNVLTITKTLTDEDIREITGYTTENDFRELSDRLAQYIKNKNKRKQQEKQGRTGTAPEPPAQHRDGTRRQAEKPERVWVQPPQAPESTKPHTAENYADTRMRTVPPASADTREIASGEEPQEIILGDDSTVMEKTVMSAKAKLIFWAIAVLTLPLTAALAAFLGALFVLSVITVCAFIAIAFTLVLVEVAAGGVCFFVGLIYGAVKIVGGMPGTGIFEIGIGFICLGVTLVLSYLTYAFATKTLPYILKEVLAFWTTVIRRTGLLVGRLREECNRL